MSMQLQDVELVLATINMRHPGGLGELWISPSWHVEAKGDGFLVQLRYHEPDIEDRQFPRIAKPQHARKWYVSSHSTPTEVVRTAYKACLTSLEHRLGEYFTVDLAALERFEPAGLLLGGEGYARPYSPHTRVVDLATVDRYGTKDRRP